MYRRLVVLHVLVTTLFALTACLDTKGHLQHLPDVSLATQLANSLSVAQEPTAQSLPPPSAAGSSTNATLPAGQCIKHTGRVCTPFSQDRFNDVLSQCANTQLLSAGDFLPRSSSVPVEATCKSEVGAGTGFCHCNEGYCADNDQNCKSDMNQVLEETYRISTKVFGTSNLLYMAPGGKVMLGQPADPRQAQWKIAVTPNGVKHLWTEAFPQATLQEYERCEARMDTKSGLTYTSCVVSVGHALEPSASDTGWYVEIHSPGYFQLRSIHDDHILFVTEDKAVECCDALNMWCPSSYGALRFDPPLARFVFDEAEWDSQSGGSIKLYFLSYCVAICLTCALCGLHSELHKRFDVKETRFDDGLEWCCLIPLYHMAALLGVKNSNMWNQRF